jgi:hypothetical protein
MGWNIHLRIKDASCSVNNAYSLIECLNLINRTSLTSHNRNYVESQFLRMEISGEAEGQGLLFSSRNLNIVSSVGKIADHRGRGMSTNCQWLQGRKCASNDSYIDRLGLVVGEVKQSLCGVSIDELHAEDLGLWEGGRDGDCKVWGRGRRFELFFSLGESGISFGWRLGIALALED